MEEATAPKSYIRVTLPPSATPGSRLNIETDGGRKFEITVPDTCKPGDTISVIIPEQEMPIPSTVQPLVQGEPLSEGSGDGGGQKKSKSYGAAAVGAVVGTVVFGPIVGVVCAGSAYYAASRHEGPISEAVRTVGSAASVAAKSVVDNSTKAAKSIGIFDRLKSASDAAAAKLYEVDQRYKITDNVKAAADKTVAKVVEIDAKYEISSTASAAAKTVVDKSSNVAKSLAGGGSASASASTSTSGSTGTAGT